MNKIENLLLFMVSLLSILGVSGCSSTASSDNLQSNTVNGVVFSAEDFKSPSSSRTTFDITDNGASFKWAAKDTIGIFPASGMQTYFAMTSGADTNTATFSGGDWALKEKSKYYAYYPFSIVNSYATNGLINQIPVSFKRQQIQVGNDNRDNVGTCDFMYAPVTTSSNGALAFKFNHLVSFLQLTLNVPEIETFKKLTISSSSLSDVFAETGKYDLASTTPSIVPITKTSSLSMNLSNISTTATNKTLTLYMMIPPVNFSTEDLKVKLSSDISDYTGVVSEKKDYKAGYFYKLTSNLTKEVKKHITKINITNIDFPGTITMKYSNNKLSKYMDFENLKTLDSISYNQDITYSGNTVIMKGKVYWQDCEQTYILDENGYAVSCYIPNRDNKEINTVFDYSPDGYLTKAIQSEKDLSTLKTYTFTYKISYQNCNVSQVIETRPSIYGDGIYTYNLSYDSKLNKSLIPNYGLAKYLYLYIAAQYAGILGKMCPLLPTSITSIRHDEGTTSWDIIYTLDKDGFIIKSTESDGEVHHYTYE